MVETFFTNLSRRLFSKSASIFGLSAVFSMAKAVEASTWHCFIGHYDVPGSPYFSMGALVLSDLDTQRRNLSDIRDKAKYYRILRSRTTENLKPQFSNLLIKYLLLQQKMYFVCLQFERTNSWPDIAIERDVEYIAMHRYLLEAIRLGFTTDVTLHLVDHGVTPNDVLAKNLSLMAPWKPQVKFGYYSDDTLLQFASFLTGLLNARLNKSAVRLRMLEDACKQLNVVEMSESTLAQNRIVQIRKIRL